ncbi:Allantoin permease [Wickerhamomyces ciferrii]|uniref:Allantoin permease n=1 Tax=Wickerhamomyces ciferrii (strain ATCC 14091 / BCRC 22168 / CBS 111 / JCM 3599 / NBRC 0793 / NRRL Y-1031 F-60-10) TaxID=1206466 RepID=K0KYP3_WICCF|nr:Allantoin permease [Wickerhamomyces ciferrii]CCH46198.1 Allantoin permease [Wickerhamomyces ciferrii]
MTEYRDDVKKQTDIELERIDIDQDVGTSSSFEQYQKQQHKNPLQKFLYKISLQKNEDLSLSEQFLVNKDLEPVHDEIDRPWRWWNYVSFWIADAFNVNTWQIAATGVQAGLTWWETWISVWIGYSLVGVFLFISQRVGSHYHIAFPVSCRTSFGTFGSIWPIINRVVMAIIWYSVQSWLGAQSVGLCLKAIFSANIVNRIPNKLASSGTTSFDFLAYFLFCLFQLPFIYTRPQSLRHLFTVKAWVCATAGVAFLVWTIVRAGGIGPVVHQKTTLQGSAHAWAWVNSIMNSLANFATLIVNSPDFSRLAKKPKDASLSQFLSIPICFAVTSLIGILASSASTAMYGETLWSPLDLLDRYVKAGTSGDRAGVFFIGAAFALAQVGTNISANSISAGTDGSALLPKFVNIRRGGFICATIAFTLCPWNFFTSSANFTTYLSAYAVFLSSIAGVIAADYCVVRRGYINVFHLYSNGPKYNYSYNKLGINWRGYAAYICGILPNVVGFAGAVGNKVPKGATYVYNLSFFTGYISAFVVYCILCYFFPIDGIPVKKFLTEKGWYEETIDFECEDFMNEIQNDHPNDYQKQGKFF